MNKSLILTVLALTALDLPTASAAGATAEETLQLGIDYAYGRKGKKKDEKKALELYKEAAAQGSAEATYRCARMYYYGVGTAADKKQAKEYYTQAAALGHGKAAQELEKFFGVEAAPAKGAALAPASVKGKVLVVDYSAAKISEYDHATKSYGQEHAWEWDKQVSWEFDKSRQPAFEGGELILYTKEGPDTATVKIEGWESATIFHLHFDTPTSGTMTEETVAEGQEWTAKGIRFRLK